MKQRAGTTGARLLLSNPRLFQYTYGSGLTNSFLKGQT